MGWYGATCVQEKMSDLVRKRRELSASMRSLVSCYWVPATLLASFGLRCLRTVFLSPSALGLTLLKKELWVIFERDVRGGWDTYRHRLHCIIHILLELDFFQRIFAFWVNIQPIFVFPIKSIITNPNLINIHWMLHVLFLTSYLILFLPCKLMETLYKFCIYS